MFQIQANLEMATYYEVQAILFEIVANLWICTLQCSIQTYIDYEKEFKIISKLELLGNIFLSRNSVVRVFPPELDNVGNFNTVQE